MKLSTKSIAPLIHGAYSVTEREGYLTFSHYDEKQNEYLKFSEFFYDRASFSSSVTIEFETDATFVSVDYKIFKVGSYDTVDLYANGVAVAIIHMKDRPDKGRLEFTLPDGKKKVVIYLPIDLNIGIKNLVIDGKWKNPKKNAPKVLWMGDSITQGFGTFITSETYVNVANRVLGYEILNQGIGGYYYDEKIITPMDNFTPDKIIVSMGTNQHRSPDKKERIEKYFEALDKVYNGIPVLAITPIWRCNPGTDMDMLVETANIIKEVAAKYPNVKVVDGFTLVPNLRDYFCDELHPNALGGELYGNNLVKAIKALKF